MRDDREADQQRDQGGSGPPGPAGRHKGGDPDAQLGFYAEDAQLRVVDAARPEGLAFELKGKADIGKYLRAVRDGGAGRKLKVGAVFGGRGLAFVEECRYPNGARVWAQTMLEAEDGLVVRQTDAVGRGTKERSGSR